jgi:hypothetical protein
MRKLAILFFACVAIVPLSLTRPALAQREPRNLYSFACNSSYFTLKDFENQPTVISPDGEKRVRLTKDGQFIIQLGSTVVAGFGLPEISANIEVGWSPDSRQFFISYSDGGAIGGYRVHMYRLNGKTLAEGNLPALVAERFKAKHWCESRGNNLFFLAWTPNSRIAFLVAEVYPTGDCGEAMGTYRGYAVDTVNAKVLRVFGESRTEAIEKQCRASGKLVLGSTEK